MSHRDGNCAPPTYEESSTTEEHPPSYHDIHADDTNDGAEALNEKGQVTFKIETFLPHRTVDPYCIKCNPEVGIRRFSRAVYISHPVSPRTYPIGYFNQDKELVRIETTEDLESCISGHDFQADPVVTLQYGDLKHLKWLGGLYADMTELQVRDTTPARKPRKTIFGDLSMKLSSKWK